MTWIKVHNSYLEDPIWMTAGPDSFMLHMAAMCWCDRQFTDGRVPKAQTRFLCPALTTPRRVNAAVRALLEHELWTDDLTDYVINNYLDHGLPAEEKRATQKKWAEDKRRRRWHNNGVHDLCDSAICRGAAAMSASDSGLDSDAESEDLYPTLHDPTRHDPTGPDPTGGEGRVQEEGPMPHLYVDDGSGASCDSCGLPEANGRHLREVSGASA